MITLDIWTTETGECVMCALKQPGEVEVARVTAPTFPECVPLLVTAFKEMQQETVNALFASGLVRHAGNIEVVS